MSIAMADNQGLSPDSLLTIMAHLVCFAGLARQVLALGGAQTPK